MGRSTKPAPEPWHPVRIVSRAVLFAVAVTSGAALVAFSMNEDTAPTISAISEPYVQRLPAQGTTLAPLPRVRRGPEAAPSPVEEALTEQPAEYPTPAMPTPSRSPSPSATPSPSPTPSPTSSPTPKPSPTPTPSPSPSPSPTQGNGLCEGVLGVLCP